MNGALLTTLFIVVRALTASASTPDTLTVDAAVSIALKSNYGILIARDEAGIAKANNTPGNAGMMPSAAITVSDNYLADGTISQKPKGGSLSSSNGSVNNLNATAALSWTVFDGGKMFITKARLAELESFGVLQLRDMVTATVFEVTSAFYDVIRQKQQLASISKVLTYNQERLVIMQTSFAQGLVPKTNLLQARIDLNVDKENVVIQLNAIANAKRTLNQLLSRGPAIAFEVSDSIPLGYVPDKENLLSQLLSDNTAVLATQKQVTIAHIGVKEAASQLLPKVSINGGYGWSQNDNTASSISMNRTAGPQIGGTLSIPLYQSGNTARQIKTAKLQLQSAEYSLEAAKLDATAQLQKALNDFTDQEALLKIEEDNAGLARENLEISMQRLRFGQATALELRQAEESYEQSLTRLIDIKYNLKLAEIKIKRLVGEL
jgi:outer membrane protein